MYYVWFSNWDSAFCSTTLLPKLFSMLSILLMSGNHLYDRIISQRGKSWVNETNFPVTFWVDWVSISSQVFEFPVRIGHFSESVVVFFLFNFIIMKIKKIIFIICLVHPLNSIDFSVIYKSIIIARISNIEKYEKVKNVLSVLRKTRVMFNLPPWVAYCKLVVATFIYTCWEHPYIYVFDLCFCDNNFNLKIIK